MTAYQLILTVQDRLVACGYDDKPLGEAAIPMDWPVRLGDGGGADDDHTFFEDTKNSCVTF